MKILTDRERVQKLLENRPNLRDDDFKLIAYLFYEDIKLMGEDPEVYTAFAFITQFSKNKLTNPQSVIRLRCKLQEEFPHLRGSTWLARHKEEVVVVQDLNTIKT